MFATKITMVMMVCILTTICCSESFAKDQQYLLTLNEASVNVPAALDDVNDIAGMPVCCGEKPGFSFTVILSDDATEFDHRVDIVQSDLDFTVLYVSYSDQQISSVKLPADGLDLVARDWVDDIGEIPSDCPIPTVSLIELGPSDQIRGADVGDAELSDLVLRDQDLLSDVALHDEDLPSQLSEEALSDLPGDASLTRLTEYVSGIELRLEQQDDLHLVLDAVEEV